MLFLDCKNCVFDTVDGTTEVCEGSIIDELVDLGLVNKCLEGTSDNIKFSDEYAKYAETESARGMLLNRFNNDKYELTIEKEDNSYKLTKVHVKSDDVRIEIPFFVSSFSTEVTQAEELTKGKGMSFIKIVKLSSLSYNWNNEFEVFDIKCNIIDLSELNLGLTSVCFKRCSIGNVVLNNTVGYFSFIDCNIGALDFNNIDLDKIIGINSMFSGSVYQGGLDLRGLSCINGSSAFSSATVFGSVKVGKLSCYKRMFNTAKIRGTLYMRGIKLDDLSEEDFIDIFTYSVIEKLDLRGTSFPCIISMQYATIGELYLTDADIVLKDSYTTKGLTLNKLIFDSVSKVDTSRFYTGLYEILELEEIHFMNCDIEIILQIINYMYKDIMCWLPVKKIRIIQDSEEQEIKDKESVRKFLSEKCDDKTKNFLDKIVVL